MKPLDLRNREDLIETWELEGDAQIHLFDLDGTPCDCVIAALDGGLEFLNNGAIPSLTVSGVNLGPNMSQDCLHSGTIGAARESSMYGVPSIASSLTVFDDQHMDVAVSATVQCIETIIGQLPHQAKNIGRKEHGKQPWHIGGKHGSYEADDLHHAFSHGDLFLNLNIPPRWNSEWKSTRLGVRWYKNAVSIKSDENQMTTTFTIGASTIDMSTVESGDCDAIEEEFGSISSLSTWPQTHPFSLSENLLTYAFRHFEGFPSWLK